MAKRNDDKWLREQLSRLPLESPGADFTSRIMEKVEALPVPVASDHSRIRTIFTNIFWIVLASVSVGIVLYLYAPKPSVDLEEPRYLPYISQLLQNTWNSLGETLGHVKNPGMILIGLGAILLIIVIDQAYKKITLRKAFLF